MKNRHAPAMLLAALTALVPCAPALAQLTEQPKSGGPPPTSRGPQNSPARRQQREDDRNRDEEVVRITSDLVQVDAVVKDEQGRHVTDLTADDFEIYEAGKPQKITAFTHVSVQPDAKAAPEPAKTPAPAAAERTPRAPLRREETRRTVALVVDDLCSSHPSVGAVRAALDKFIGEQVRPGDLVAVFRVRGGNSVLQQFTSDRNLLRRAVEKVRWYPPPLGVECHGESDPARGGLPSGQGTFEDGRSSEARERIEDDGRNRAVQGTLGVLSLTLRGMRGAPGRKSLVLFSDLLPMVARRGEVLSAYDTARRVVDEANRAGVVIYAVDPRGVTAPTYISAAQGPAPAWPDQLPPTQRPAMRADAVGASNLLAEGTGGLFLHTNNNLNQLLGRVLEDQSGYYLIGYRPSEESLKKGRDTFRDIKVRVRRPGLAARSRKGFYAPSVEPARRTPRRGADSELYDALVAPIDKGDIELRLTAGFKDAPATGPVVRTLLHVDGRSVTLADEPNGWKKLVLDVAAATIGDDGKIADEFTRTHTVRLDPAGARVVRENGLTYAADVPVKKPGAYQFRIVLRDAASQRVGSASQFLEAPDLAKRDRLALSGITLREAAAAASASAAERAGATAETALAAVITPADPAVRRFRPGAVLAYDYQIYTGTQSAGARLTTQTQLYKDGQLAFTSPEEPFDAAAAQAAGRLSDSRLFKLGERAAPGDYALQILVHETDPKGKRRTASQWVDFEVVK